MSLSPTANQSARPRSAANIARHAAERVRRGEPESGGDRGGPRHFPTGRAPGTVGHGIDTSEGTAKPGGPYSTDRTGSRNRNLYRGRPFSNAERPRFVPKRGNSEGPAELASKTTTETVSKAAKSRLSRGNNADKQVTGRDEFAGLPFRREARPFGPVRNERRTHARDHVEHESSRKF
jgi:hypothetical protein